MKEVWEVALAVIASLGGAGAVIATVVKCASDRIAERLSAKYQLQLSKELENHKKGLQAELEEQKQSFQREIETLKQSLARKSYVSRVRFDTEFEIYRNLSQCFFDLFVSVNSLIPVGLAYVPNDEKLMKEMEEKNFLNAEKSAFNAQNQLHRNAPFISQDFFDAYQELLKLSNIQLSAFRQRWNASFFATEDEKRSLSRDDYNRTEEIQSRLKALNGKIREYLEKLDVNE